jgi:hypothetical protein
VIPPRVSLKRLLASVTLIAIGIGLAASAYHHLGDLSSPFDPFELACIWLGGGAIAGAGALCPFQRVGAGALLGFMSQGVIIALVT